MNIHIVLHEAFEAPGAIEKWAHNKGFPITYTRLYEDDDLPIEVDGYDMAIVMGGPQSPASSQDVFPYFDAAKEISWIKDVVDQGKIVLGICLGAQLIGEAMGARFSSSPYREIGVYPVTLTPAGKEDPFFSTLPDEFSVGHWHMDMPGLTHESVVLAYSAGCPRQIVRYAPKVYGFQCHMEFTPDSIEGMISNCPDDLIHDGDQPFVQSAEVLRQHCFKTMNQILFKFLDYMSATTSV